MFASRNRKHNRSSFFKYMTASTAEIVLSSRSLRWSSPLLFNDPFDVPRELTPGVSPQDLVAAVARRFAALIEQPPEDASSLTPRLQLIIDAVKNGIPASVRAELIASLDSEAKASIPTGDSLEAFRAMWRKSIADMRILSLTESPSHIAMWYHYAGKYTGVVLEVACVDTLDSAWLAAQRVDYPQEKPGVYTVEGWAQLLMLKPELSTQQMLQTSTFTKSPDWSYEREWRVVTFKRPTDTGHFTDYRFDPRELVTIYLGPHIKSDDRARLIALASQYPNAKVVAVSLDLSRELLFEEMSG